MKKARMIIDILMVMLLPLLMAYSLIGENIHEVLGVCMFALFIAHHVINRKWWTGLFKGKCSHSLTMANQEYDFCLTMLQSWFLWQMLDSIYRAVCSEHKIEDNGLYGGVPARKILHSYGQELKPLRRMYRKPVCFL